MKFPLISYESFLMMNVIWIAIGIITFIVLFKINAPYGRHTRSSWGPMISNRLAWFIMEVPVLLIVGAAVFFQNERLSYPIAVMAGLFCAHYLHRSLLFPLRLNTRGKQMPVLIMVSAILFNFTNGFFIGYYFRYFAHYDATWLTSSWFISGLIIFIAGASINVAADSHLINLRKNGTGGYMIPRGPLFNWISCPNHFGEMLEWLGFALMCDSLPAWSFFIWTVANLPPRALAHHRWYREKFPEYPVQRRAVIPFLI
ncbi:MAG TPA: DUF1295 domain-containing protein, partial [Chitinophagales bacterium]|nr:DUF1295 domain-containing protein [Chitinophagales bacterium]